MKRLLSILLCFCFILTLFPATFPVYVVEKIYADEVDDEGFSQNIEDNYAVMDIQSDNFTDEATSEEVEREEALEDDPDAESEDLVEAFFSDFTFDTENAIELNLAEYDFESIIIYFKDVSEFHGKEKQYWDEVSKLTRWGIDYIEALDAYVIAVNNLDKNPNAVLNRFKNSKFIESVELNYTATFDEIPNDPHYIKYQSSALTTINAFMGWDIINGGGPTIAIVDSGIAHHTDLPPLLPGYSAVAGLSPNNDIQGHGTKVAGVIGMVGNNGIGGVGINWNAQIMPVKVDTATGSLTVANLAKGIIWAADNGARVINLSLGTTADSATLKSAVDYAVGKGCVLIAATGNSGTSAVSYPARYANVIGVGSPDGTSNYGIGLDVLAVGTYFTTTAAGSYGNAGGTSFASPQVAGLVSLIMAVGGDPISLIKSTAGTDGMINMGAALQAAGGVATTQPETKPTPPPNPSIELIGFSEVTYTEGDTYKEDGYKATDYKGKDITAKVVVTNNLNMKIAGIYNVTYKVTDDYGGNATTTRSVKVNPAPPVPPPATAPKITIIGSNPIILHSTSSTPYKEQKAKAIDYDGADISSLVIVSGAVDRAKPGNYAITYKVTSPKSGLSASTSREVRIIEPTEKITRMPYGFNGQSKQGGIITHTNVKADAFGWVDLKVTSLDKNMTIKAELIDSATKKAVITDTFSAIGAKQYRIDSGKYELKVTIDKANGNGSYKIDLLMPEVLTFEFLDNEVPLAADPKIMYIGSNPIILHQDSATPYIEQGARAVDYYGNNISDRIEIIGKPDRYEAGTYIITYKVTDSKGLTADTTREVRILAPLEINIDEVEIPKPTFDVAMGTANQTRGAVITNCAVANLRSSHGLKYPVVAALPANTTVTVYESKYGWYLVSDGTARGWVYRGYLNVRE